VEDEMSGFMNKEQELESRIENLEATVNKSNFSAGLSGVLDILNKLIKEFETDPCFTSEEQDHIDSKIRGVEEAIDRINFAFKETT
jgi:hypothetical protein